MTQRTIYFPSSMEHCCSSNSGDSEHIFSSFRCKCSTGTPSFNHLDIIFIATSHAVQAANLAESPRIRFVGTNNDISACSLSTSADVFDEARSSRAPRLTLWLERPSQGQSISHEMRDGVERAWIGWFIAANTEKNGQG
jgi:hypothetical protein